MNMQLKRKVFSPEEDARLGLRTDGRRSIYKSTLNITRMLKLRRSKI